MQIPDLIQILVFQYLPERNCAARTARASRPIRRRLLQGEGASSRLRLLKHRPKGQSVKGEV